MLVVVAYGIYNFFFTSTSPKNTADPVSRVADVNKFVTDVAASLKIDDLKTNTYLLDQARAEWTNDPFLHTTLIPEAEVMVESPATQQPEMTYSYTGYLKMGDQKLAIINGAEYEQGDELIRGGVVVKSIESKQVIIGKPGEDDDIILPLKETS